MIKNDKITGGQRERQGIEDNNLIRNPRLLKSIIDYLLLKVNQKKPVLANNLRWTTTEGGLTINAQTLDSTNPYQMQFSEEIYRGDRAKNDTLNGWTFTAGLPGFYNVSNQIVAQIDPVSVSEAETYIQNLQNGKEIEYNFYKNGVSVKPVTSYLNFIAYDIPNVQYNYFYRPTGTIFFTKGNLDKIIYFNAGDTLDLRVGFTTYAGVSGANITFWSEMNINYINNYGKVI
jgi:hypothetical protein